MYICYSENKVMSVFYEEPVYSDKSIEDLEQWPFCGSESQEFSHLRWKQVRDDSDDKANMIELALLMCETKRPLLVRLVCSSFR